MIGFLNSSYGVKNNLSTTKYHI